MFIFIFIQIQQYWDNLHKMMTSLFMFLKSNQLFYRDTFKNSFKNYIYSCDDKAAFSACITPVSRNNLNNLIWCSRIIHYNYKFWEQFLNIIFFLIIHVENSYRSSWISSGGWMSWHFPGSGFRYLRQINKHRADSPQLMSYRVLPL